MDFRLNFLNANLRNFHLLPSGNRSLCHFQYSFFNELNWQTLEIQKLFASSRCKLLKNKNRRKCYFAIIANAFLSHFCAMHFWLYSMLSPVNGCTRAINVSIQWCNTFCDHSKCYFGQYCHAPKWNPFLNFALIYRHEYRIVCHFVCRIDSIASSVFM